ncbi:UNVERIFIED_CONTAM: hypothetical protein Sangu_3066000 [Sesamum angustifolium]|uniref:Reverse transcriptase domain-containing protein n=1 Tax=Sesamum angustifolium TaxID=2727405 RepID=A0AAW2KEA3_9LAMI
MATVENGWNQNVDGTTQFCLCRKLKALKGHLKAFNNLHFSHISVRAKDADLALQDAQIQLESDPENATIRDSVRELRKKAVFLAEAERHFYYQKAKLHFLKMGDRNTKFFHDMVKRNAAKSSILAITKTDGTTITVVTPEEVKQAIFSISDNKAPGPDGYSAYFFKRAWHIVGDQVCAAMLDFFRSGRLLRQLNHSIIALVRKSDHCPTVADYRPISCCNEMVRQYTRKRISPRCTINVDLHKAFDSVSWTFLSQVLHGRSYDVLSRGPSIVHILMECLQEFRDISGLDVKIQYFFTAGIENNMLCDILARTEFTRGEMPVRYLIPLAAQAVGSGVFLATNLPTPSGSRRENPPICRNFSGSRNEHRRISLGMATEEGGLTSFNGLPKSATESFRFGSPEVAIQHMAEWSNSKGLDTSKAYEYFRPKRAKQPWQTVIWKAFIPRSTHSF